ncbi:hypothetical protein BGZ58_003181 [Dissophora ornata]|nr:hypothetical protein BGZ58_003181 [Dissophora ornata]
MLLLHEDVRQSQVVNNTEAKHAIQHQLQSALHTQACGSAGSHTPKDVSTDGKVRCVVSDFGAANSSKTSALSSAVAAMECDDSKNAGAGGPAVVKINRLCTLDRGRVMVSESFIPKGTLLGRIAPHAIVCDTENRRRRCGFCLALTVAKGDDNDGDYSEVVTSCQDCGEIWYCDEACRAQDWSMIHGYECGFLKDLYRGPSSSAGLEWRTADDGNVMTRFGELNPFDQDYCRVLMRVLVMRFKEYLFYRQGSPAQLASRGEGITEEGLQPFADVDDMVENRESFSKEKIQGDMMDVARVLEIFQGYLQQSQGQRCKDTEGEENGKEGVVPRLTLSELLGLVCKEECNSFGLYEYAPATSSLTNAKTGYGLGVFTQDFMYSFNHSCAPNVYHVAHKSTLLLYSARDIRPGEELNITYMEFGPKHRVPEARQRRPEDEEARKAGFEKRRGYLEKNFYFECGCPRCAWELSLDQISTSHSDSNTSAASTGVGGMTLEEERFIREGLLCAQKECFGFYAPPDVLDILHGTRSSKGLWACVACGHNQG